MKQSDQGILGPDELINNAAAQILTVQEMTNITNLFNCIENGCVIRMEKYII